MPQRPIQSVIRSQDLLSAPRTMTVAEAARLMKLRSVSAILVVDAKGRLAGIFTERIGDVMTANPRTIAADRPFALALLTMHEGGFRHLPVVSDGRPVGMVTARDALGLEWRDFVLELERREHLGESIG
jgi:CBS domain-containing protein